MPEKTVEHTKVEYITKTDTIIKTNIKYDTVKFNNIQYRTMVYHDTAWVVDSAREYHYAHPDYDFRANAVKLNDFNITVHRADTVTVEHYNTVETIVKQKDRRFGVGLYGGLGYDPINRNFTPQIGVGITFKLTK